jgi:hypothetical protein
MNSKAMKIPFKTQYGIVLNAEFEIIGGVDEKSLFSKSTVVMELIEIRGVIAQAATMTEAFAMLDEMLDTFLELDLGLELTDLGFDYDTTTHQFHYVNKNYNERRN